MNGRMRPLPNAAPGWLRRAGRALRRALRLAGRPVRGQRGAGLVVRPFRGVGSATEVFLTGRVFRQSANPARPRTLLGDLADLVRRLTRRGVADVEVHAAFARAEQSVVTDDDGYFMVHLHLPEPPPDDRDWHRVTLQVTGGEPAAATGLVYVPPRHARQLVISDIDDTVMFTGVANKLKMLWRMFMQGPHSRLAFPGVAAFYRALHDGAGGDERNPMLYVSRGPWALYEALETFFNLHRIPVGPVLFLREWGIKLHRPLPRRARGHKLDVIRRILGVYGDLPVVLIGDSGQHDPEVYARVVHEHPGRVLAVYIRNVSRGPGRQREIDHLAREVQAAGSTLLLAGDTGAMAEHALAHGLVAADAVRAVVGERRAESDPTAAFYGPPAHAQDAEDLDRVLDGAGEATTNVELEPSRANRARARRESRSL